MVQRLLSTGAAFQTHFYPSLYQGKQFLQRLSLQAVVQPRGWAYERAALTTCSSTSKGTALMFEALGGARAGPQATGGGAVGERAQLVIHYGVAEDQGRRPGMEDRHAIIPALQVTGADGATVAFASVLDGHMGSQAAEAAAVLLPQVLASNPALGAAAAHGNTSGVGPALASAFRTVDEKVLRAARQDGKDYGSTATVALCFAAHRALFVAHVGDSRSVLSRGKRALRLTRDHKPSVAGESERIRGAGGEVNQQQNYVVVGTSMLAMTRALGDPSFKEGDTPVVEAVPDVARVELQHDDEALIIASDGLWDVVADQEAADIVGDVLAGRSGQGDGDRATAAAQLLVTTALNKGTRDNVTAIVGLFEWR